MCSQERENRAAWLVGVAAVVNRVRMSFAEGQHFSRDLKR